MLCVLYVCAMCDSGLNRHRIRWNNSVVFALTSFVFSLFVSHSFIFHFLVIFLVLSFTASWRRRSGKRGGRQAKKN